ncbi:hypothetical protein V5G98_08565 [Vibrio cholerae]|uniref:hypothetical protein n=1 Tax=Vibrio cholerae TaxID=666 RepID=UPI003966F8A1|nr:hypothetical protein [Vibrio cholerae]EJL6695748.1 hypothetical protein [Vibrio cholerae]
MKVFILGCGEVGTACANNLLSSSKELEQLILQVRTEKSFQKLSNALFENKEQVVIKTIDIFSDTGSTELSNIIIKYKPDYIIDCLPVGNILCKIRSESSLETATKALFDYFSALSCAFELGVKRIVKVSSGGTGGLGLSCPYRHGLSSREDHTALLWKSYFNGALHQLLLNLHESANGSVGLTIPRALIGYEDAELPYQIRCGDGTTYTQPELLLCASPSQFGFITKEEVAKITLDILFARDLSKDQNHQACQAGINSSPEDNLALKSICKKLKQQMELYDINEISLGSLGNKVTKDMIELALAIIGKNNHADDPQSAKELLLSRMFFSETVLNHYTFSATQSHNDRIINCGKESQDFWLAVAENALENTGMILDINCLPFVIKHHYESKGIMKK